MSHPRKVEIFEHWAKNMVKQATVGDRLSHAASTKRGKKLKGKKKLARRRRKRFHRKRRTSD